MTLSREVRRLENNWNNGQFPKHLEFLELTNLRGWAGQRIEFKFPIVAIVGENGMGKSTIIQGAASLYKPPAGDTGYFASNFFPDTAWEELTGIEIRGSVKEGTTSRIVSVRKPTTRWRGIETRRERSVRFLDLKRILPIYSKTGYSRLAKRQYTEASVDEFDRPTLDRLSSIVGKTYTLAKQSTTNADANRKVPVLQTDGTEYSGFHQGAGETTITELLSLDIPYNSIVLIDEIETSLHPRAQRRLMRDLAEISRLKHVQFIVTTHSPYILDELPIFARIQILKDQSSKQVVHGVSSEFALSRMDEDNYPEIDIYVEDIFAKILVEEIIAMADLSLLSRVQIIPYGAANVGKSLGLMNNQNRFPKATIVLLDGDQDPSAGCLILPGNDAPERVIYDALNSIGFPKVAGIIARSHSDLVNNCQIAMTLPNHHDWNKSVADNIICGGYELWRALCRTWVEDVYRPDITNFMVLALRDKLQ
jgi:predicted ATPase